MKNLKLLIAFLAGVAITLLFAGKPLHLSFPHPTWNISGGIGGTLAVIVLILGGAYLSQRSSEGAPNGFFDFLQKLRTSESDSWLGGVCGGLGRYTPVPSWVWRLGFVALTFYFGCGLLIYLLLWICLPSGETKNHSAA